jgi:hypothetical protein
VRRLRFRREVGQYDDGVVDAVLVAGVGARVLDEGYGIIDVYVEFKAKLDPGAYRDDVLVRQIVDRLRAVGYQGPDFGHSDPGLQESRLIVLEAPEEFAAFAKRRGWKNLAEEFDD